MVLNFNFASKLVTTNFNSQDILSHLRIFTYYLENSSILFYATELIENTFHFTTFIIAIKAMYFTPGKNESTMLR